MEFRAVQTSGVSSGRANVGNGSNPEAPRLTPQGRVSAQLR
jgi:hypothetical protein